MSILTWPSWVDFIRPDFRLAFNTVSHVSGLTRATQTVEFPGALWKFEAGIRPALRADYEDWLAFLAELRGSAGRFYAGDPAARTPRGTAAASPGTPLVKGASQTGSTLLIDGAPNSATGWLLKGDRVAFDLPSGLRSLHRVTAQVDSDGSGNASLGLVPPLRESPADNEPLILTDPTCVMMLAEDDLAGGAHDEAGFLALTISAVEAFDTGA